MLSCSLTRTEKHSMLPSGQLPLSILALTQLSKPTASSIRVADRAMYEHRYQVFSKLEDLSFPAGVIDWDIPVPNSQNTYHLYLHSLTFIDYACCAFIKTQDPAYLRFAHDSLWQWLDYAARHPYNPRGKGKGKGSGNSHLWYDHTVSSRARLMIHFYAHAVAQGLLNEADRQRIVDALFVHADFLCDPRHYRKFNHGLMMDRALLLIAEFMREAEPDRSAAWTRTAVARLREGMERDFTPEMVHRENSAGYHVWALDFFSSLVDPLVPLDPAFAADLRTRLERAEAFLHNMIQPDGILAAVGDTLGIPRKEPPLLQSQLYPDAGIAIFATPDAADVRRSTWIHFKAGYATHTHKHADDLSFILHAGGFPIFIDPGMMSYAATPASRAFAAAPAHNTLIVDDASYPIERRVLEVGDNANLPVIGLIDPCTIADDYATVGGFNSAYAGLELARRLIYLPPGLLIIHDRFRCETAARKISQLFHVSPLLRIARSTPREALLTPQAAETKFNLRLSQLSLPLDLEYACGDTERDRGFYTEKFDTRLPLEELAFSRKEIEGDFVTAIGWCQTDENFQATLQKTVELHPDHLQIRTPAGTELSFSRTLERSERSP